MLPDHDVIRKFVPQNPTNVRNKQDCKNQMNPVPVGMGKAYVGPSKRIDSPDSEFRGFSIDVVCGNQDGRDQKRGGEEDQEQCPYITPEKVSVEVFTVALETN